MYKFLIITLYLGFVLGAGAQTTNYYDLLKTEISKERETLVKSSMQIKDRDKKTFWAIYGDYDKEMTALRDEQFALIKDYIDNYENLNDKKTSELLKASLKSQESRLALERKYYERISAEVTSEVASQFFEVNDQIEIMIRLQIWSKMPLVKK